MLKRKILSLLSVLLMTVSFFILTADYRPLSTEALATPPINRNHTTHDPAKCHNLQFNLLIPTSGFADDMQVLRGIVPVQIEMQPGFKGYGRDDGYGVFITVDYKAVYEEDGIEFGEGNLLAMSYQLDTTDLNNGTHIINVNVNDYYNHSGSVLLKVIVDN